jgi:hypothetical protein
MSQLFRFSLIVDGHLMAQFTELQGITTKVDVVEFPTQPVNCTLVLCRPHIRENTMSVRHWQTSRTRKNCALVAYDTGGKYVAQWKMTNAFPSQAQSDARTEKVTLNCDFIQRV